MAHDKNCNWDTRSMEIIKSYICRADIQKCFSISIAMLSRIISHHISNLYKRLFYFIPTYEKYIKKTYDCFSSNLACIFNCLTNNFLAFQFECRLRFNYIIQSCQFILTQC